MSYTIVKKIHFQNDGVYITSASSNVFPRYYDEFRSDYYSNLMKEEGFSGVVKSLATNMQAGNIKFLKGYKFNNAMLQAKAELEGSQPQGLVSFLNGEAYGDYVVKRVDEIYNGRGRLDSIAELGKLQAMRKDPESVFSMCKGNVEAFFFADVSIQNNLDLCRRYVRDFAGELLFQIPPAAQEDKEAVLYAVSKHGCSLRNLSEKLQDDENIVLAAFGAVKYPEHLPDLISPRLQNDTEFMKKIIEVEPKLHFSRSKALLNNPDVVLKLAEKATWIGDFSYFPDEIRNAPNVQRAMAARLHDDGLTEEQKVKRVEVLARVVKPEFLVAEQLKDAVALEYKGIIFDDWAVDASGEGQGIWGEMCECCAEKFKDLLSDELDNAGAVGACSVKGCNVVGADSDNAVHYYVDFKPELIKPLSKDQVITLENKDSLDSRIAAAQAISETAADSFVEKTDKAKER